MSSGLEVILIAVAWLNAGYAWRRARRRWREAAARRRDGRQTCPRRMNEFRPVDAQGGPRHLGQRSVGMAGHARVDPVLAWRPSQPGVPPAQVVGRDRARGAASKPFLRRPLVLAHAVPRWDQVGVAVAAAHLLVLRLCAPGGWAPAAGRRVGDGVVGQGLQGVPAAAWAADVASDDGNRQRPRGTAAAAAAVMGPSAAGEGLSVALVSGGMRASRRRGAEGAARLATG